MGSIGYRPSSTHIFVGMGKRIDDLCYERNISYKELSYRVGTEKRNIINLMLGYDGKVSVLVGIADVFGVSVDYLISGKGDSDK